MRTRSLSPTRGRREGFGTASSGGTAADVERSTDLRDKGIGDVSAVVEARLERSGKLSVIKKAGPGEDDRPAPQAAPQNLR
jgi:hypothetical protein